MSLGQNTLCNAYLISCKLAFVASEWQDFWLSVHDLHVHTIVETILLCLMMTSEVVQQPIGVCLV